MPTSVRKNPKLVIGILLLFFSLYLLARLFASPIEQELAYREYSSTSSSSPVPLVPPNHDFSLVIPKIGATAPIIKGVSPTNSQEYQSALTRGVAHAAGTSSPGEGKNIFLFSHSSSDLMTALRYNSVFYLLHYLEPGDPITVWYQDQEYSYRVTTKQIVSPSAVSYLKSGNSETLTLMTCWPPGTTLKRLLIIAEPHN